VLGSLLFFLIVTSNNNIVTGEKEEHQPLQDNKNGIENKPLQSNKSDVIENKDNPFEWSNSNEEISNSLSSGGIVQRKSSSSLFADSLDAAETSDYTSDTLIGIRQKGSSTMKRRMGRNGSSSNESETSDTDTNDVESQSSKKSIVSRNGIPPTTSPSKSRGGTSVVSARLLCRKIIHAVLTDLDDETLRREDTETILIVITLLKEAMLGIVIAFALVSFILFLDHRFLLGLPTARNFRKATFAVMNDKETLINFEENAGLKFLSVEEYESIMVEINQSANKTDLAYRIIETRNNDLKELQADMAPYDGVLDKLFETIGLDKWCESCHWGMKLSCLSRAESLEARYNTPKFEAMVSTMQNGKCRKNEEQIKEDMKKQEKVDEMMKDWKSHEKEFCIECEYDKSMNCNQRVQYLNYRFGSKIDDAKARTMVDTEECTRTFQRKQTEYMERFEANAIWGNGQTCKQRVDYLMYTYKDSERKATLGAMEKKACVGPAIDDEEEIREEDLPSAEELVAAANKADQ